MGTPRIRFRDPGMNRKVDITKNKRQELIDQAITDGKPIEFTDSRQKGLKFLASSSGTAAWRHRWTDRKTKKKQFHTIGCGISISPDSARNIVRNRTERIALGLNPDGDEEKGCPTMDAFIDDDFMDHAQRKYKSLRDVENRIKNWIRPTFGKIRLDEITKADVIRFQEASSDKVSPITANRNVALLSAIQGRAVDLEIIDNNVCKGIRKLAEGDSRDRILSDDELRRLLKVLKRRVDKKELSAQAIMLALTTAKRRSELLSLPWAQVFLEDRYFMIPAPVSKNRKWDRVELNSLARSLLVQMRADNPNGKWVFPSSRSKSGHLGSVKRAFATVLAEAGIENFRYHDCRKVVPSILLNSGAGVGLETLQQLLNHESIQSTQIYSRLKRSTVAEASELAAQKLEEALNG